MGILCRRAAATSSFKCVIVSVSLRLSASMPLSFPFGWRKSLYGSMMMIAVLEGMTDEFWQRAGFVGTEVGGIEGCFIGSNWLYRMYEALILG